MARKSADGVNKSQAIRDELEANPKAKSKDIVANLAAKGIKVTATLVYMVKSHEKRKSRKKKRLLAASKVDKSVANPVDLVLRVKKLGVEAGGMKRLKELVDAMVE